MCCGKIMNELVPNGIDASFEKHVPEYGVDNEIIIVTVNHLMENNHHIECISYEYDNKENIVYFKPGEIVKIEFSYI